MIDTNALKVNNVLGHQVGHIPKEIASALSPMIDENEIRIEGLYILLVRCLLLFFTPTRIHTHIKLLLLSSLSQQEQSTADAGP